MTRMPLFRSRPMAAARRPRSCDDQLARRLSLSCAFCRRQCVNICPPVAALFSFFSVWILLTKSLKHARVLPCMSHHCLLHGTSYHGHFAPSTTSIILRNPSSSTLVLQAAITRHICSPAVLSIGGWPAVTVLRVSRSASVPSCAVQLHLSPS